jgi:hypothetical protein
VLFATGKSPTGGFAAIVIASWLITAAAWVVAEWVAARTRVSAWSRTTGALCRGLHWASTALFVATAFLAVPLPCTLVLLAPALYLVGMGLVLPRAGLVSAVQARLFHLPHLAIATVLSCYSFWNLDDASWGTKGLRTAATSVECRSRMRRWRTIILCAWLATNGAAMAAALRLHGILSTSLNPVAELFAAFDVVLVVASLWYLVGRPAMSSQRRERRSLGYNTPTGDYRVV